ncbi:MAG: ABC transporter substrate-binding protein [Candidatus Portnoybacteria bacterium]
MPSRERWLARGLFLVLIASLIGLITSFYLDHTQAYPQAGGQYKEGIFGQPRFINPVLAQTNDADRDLSRIIFSSLLKYDGQGNLISDLAQRYSISEDGLTYEVTLKKNALWHDKQPLTADDVIFTIATIQNPEYKSPLKINWQGVKAEKIDEFSVKFILNTTYAPFLHNLTVGILPKHLWAGISPANFALAEYNLKPVGSGPYKFKDINQDKDGKVNSIELARNKNFYLVSLENNGVKGPFIDNIIFRFYTNQEDLIKAYQKGKVDGLGFLPAGELSGIRNGSNIHRINLPAYYAVFFNQTASKALSDKNVRLALAYATNKNEIIDQVLKGEGEAVESPLLSGWLGYTDQTKIYDFSLEHAQNLLESNGWKDKNEDGIREKEISGSEENLEITILTTNWPELNQAAELIKSQWEKLGARINLEIVNPTVIQQEYIRPRNYQALLFGEVLSADPDPFAFWHSSQRKDPGLNLALYQNKDVDKLLEEARQEMNPEKRVEKYAEFQKKLTEDIPAMFFYSPTYLYPVNERIKGIEIERLAIHSQRFSQIENWYIKTNRVWK